MKGFIEFIRTRGVVGFAVGFIVGKAVSDLVGGFVNDIVNPVVGLLLSGIKNLSDLSVNVFSAKIAYGDFINIAINFVVILIVVYLFFIGLKLDRLDKAKEE